MKLQTKKYKGFTLKQSPINDWEIYHKKTFLDCRDSLPKAKSKVIELLEQKSKPWEKSNEIKKSRFRK